MAKSPRICLFVPTYNVENTIVPVLQRISPEARSRIETILVVDNGSKDLTLERLQEYARQPGAGDIRIFRNRKNYFLGGSTIVALNWAIQKAFDFLICMHSDGQADPACLDEFVRRCRPDLDFVFGSRFLPDSQTEEYSRLRAAGNWVFVGLQQLLLRKRVYDIGAFIAFNLRTIASVPFASIPHDMGYQPLLVLSVARRKEIRFEEFPMSWGKVESSHVNLISYGLNHLWRLFRFAVGKIPQTEKMAGDFSYDEIQISQRGVSC